MNNLGFMDMSWWTPHGRREDEDFKPSIKTHCAGGQRDRNATSQVSSWICSADHVDDGAGFDG